MKSAVALFVLLLLTHCHSKKARRRWKANQKKPNQKFVKTSRINTFDTGWRRIEESLPKDGSVSEDDDITDLFDNKGTNNDKDEADLKTAGGQTPPDLHEKEDQTWEPQIMADTRFRPLSRIGFMKIEEILPIDDSGSEDDDITDLFDNEATNNDEFESDLERLLEDSLLQTIEENKPSED